MEGARDTVYMSVCGKSEQLFAFQQKRELGELHVTDIVILILYVGDSVPE